MRKILDYIKDVRQRYHIKKLRSSAVKEYADDPDVVFHTTAPVIVQDAGHGVNTPEEMSHSAESNTD